MILSEEQLIFRDIVQEWANEVVKPGAADRDRNSIFPTEILKQAADLGLFGVIIPNEWEGAGADMSTLSLAIEEVAAADGALSTILSVTNSVVCGPILSYGTTEQKQQYLKNLASGRKLGCFCLTEPEAGSDASAIRTRATHTSQGYVLNGSKQFVTSGSNADIAIVFAVTNPDAGKKGLTAFLVDTDNPGYEVNKIEEKLGQKSSDTASIILKNCFVSDANRLGSEGDGYKIALSNLESGRIGIAAQAVGMARSAMDAAVEYANQRTSFGQKLIRHQAIGYKLADMATQIQAARLMVWHAASLKDQGLPCLKQASMAKLFASEMAEKVCSDAIQTLGGYGYLNDFPVERIYRDVRVCQIYEGASEIQRMLIARTLES